MMLNSRQKAGGKPQSGRRRAAERPAESRKAARRSAAPAAGSHAPAPPPSPYWWPPARSSWWPPSPAARVLPGSADRERRSKLVDRCRLGCGVPNSDSCSAPPLSEPLSLFQLSRAPGERRENDCERVSQPREWRGCDIQPWRNPLPWPPGVPLPPSPTAES